MRRFHFSSPAILWVVIILITFLMPSCQNSGSSAPAASGSKTEEKEPAQPVIKDSDSKADILDIAAQSDAHSTLAKAVQAAGIEHILTNPGPLTVFAPTNAAFEALPDAELKRLMKPENKAELATLLTRHAAPGTFKQKDLRKEAKRNRKLFMATNDYFEIKLRGDKVAVNGVEIQQSISASNGVVHVVNEVILP